MPKQSALHHWAQKASAVFTEHYGWETPARFPKAGGENGLADVSWTAKFDLKGRQPTFDKKVQPWLLGPNHFLVTCDPTILPDFPGAHVTDVTSVFAQFLLRGPHRRDVLSKLTSLNVSDRAFPHGECRQTSLAHAHAILLRQDADFHLLVARDYGESVWEAVLHAGHEFHLAPFGLDNL